MFFRQMKQYGDNFSYVIADEKVKEAVVVDPSFNAAAIAQLLKDQRLKARYIVDTHGHGDHTAGNEDLKREFGARIVAHRLSGVKKDISVVDNDIFSVGNVLMRVIYTPGHSVDGICLLVDSKLLTGDTLFVGECGRTDLPGSSVEDMYHSLFDKLMKLDDGIEVYPGHDYGPKTSSTIGEEKKTNYTLEKRTLEEFVDFMSHP